MKKEMDDLLCERYPELFAERRLSIEESAMAWGPTCGDGWFDLIDVFCAEVQHAVQHGHMPPVVLKQVKEKFGSLRIRYRGGDDVTEGLARMATAMSETTLRDLRPSGPDRSPPARSNAGHDALPRTHEVWLW